MSEQSFIPTELLLAYALGQCTGDEKQSIEQALASDANTQAAYRDVCLAMEAYALAYARKSPAGNYDRILEKIQNDKRETVRESLSAQAMKGQAAQEEGRTRTKSLRMMRWWLAASVVTAVASLAFSALLYQKVETQQEAYTVLRNDYDALKQDYQQVARRSAERKKAINILFDPANKMVALDPKGEKAPRINATVCWNQRTHKVHLHAENLAPAPPGKQYQLWAVVGGKVRSVGLFRMEDLSATPKLMATLPEVQGFMITLEPEGGSAQPTLANPRVEGYI